MTLAGTITSLLPEGWRVCNIISWHDSNCWYVILTDDEWIVNGSGYSIEEAIAAAAVKTLDEGLYEGRLFSLPKRLIDEPSEAGTSLLQRLGLVSKPEPIKRRF